MAVTSTAMTQTVARVRSGGIVFPSIGDYGLSCGESLPGQSRDRSGSAIELGPRRSLRLAYSLGTSEPIKDWSLTALEGKADQDRREGRRPRVA